MSPALRFQPSTSQSHGPCCRGPGSARLGAPPDSVSRVGWGPSAPCGPRLRQLTAQKKAQALSDRSGPGRAGRMDEPPSRAVTLPAPPPPAAASSVSTVEHTSLPPSVWGPGDTPSVAPLPVSAPGSGGGEWQSSQGLSVGCALSTALAWGAPRPTWSSSPASLAQGPSAVPTPAHWLIPGPPWAPGCPCPLQDKPGSLRGWSRCCCSRRVGRAQGSGLGETRGLHGCCVPALLRL